MNFDYSIGGNLGVMQNFKVHTTFSANSRCNLHLQSINSVDFYSLTMNVIFAHPTLTKNKLIFYLSHDSSATGSYPGCILDGRSAAVSLNCQRPISVSSVNYKVFSWIYNSYRITTTDPSLIPTISFLSRLLSTSVIEYTLKCEFIQLTGWQVFSLFLHESFFDTTKRKSIMMSVFYFDSGTAAPASPASISFPHYVTYCNFFMGTTSLKGYDYTFRTQLPASQPNSFMLAHTLGSSNSFSYFAVSFYGYTELCPGFGTEPCQNCPKYCKTCHILPTFHCFQCEDNFTLSADNQKCICSERAVGDFCDDFPFGCTVPNYNSLSGHPECQDCDISKKLTLVGSTCECIYGYTFDANSECKSDCGDGVVIEQEQCDDGNTQPNDGCDSQCNTEEGIWLDKSINPPVLKSQIMLKCRVLQILKKQGENSAKLYLTFDTNQKLIFNVRKEEFEPISTNIKLKVIISTFPFEEVSINDLSLIEANQYQLLIEFPYTFNIESLEAQILLNYQNTKYKNETQKLKFQMKGDNYALKVSAYEATYKTLGDLILAVIILNAVCLIIGFFTSKFIGLESILTCQIIFYSQMLIADISRWPSGFTFLKYLKFSTGYNGFLSFTDYLLTNTLTKKMSSLGLKKLLIQNFNLSFLILLLAFVCFIICSVIRKARETFIFQKLRLMKQQKDENFTIVSKKLGFQLFRLDKFNEVTFWIANQICVWLLLPLLSSASADFLIQNNKVRFLDSSDQDNFFVQIRGQILLLSLLMMLCVLVNNFKNTWLSASSFKKLLQRPEELKYKNLLFVYLFMIGLVIFFFNNKQMGPIYSSAIVLVLHVVYVLRLILIKPYKQSLKVHTVVLFINNGILIVFFMVINLLNHMEEFDQIFIMALGFFLTGGSGMSLLLTFVRLYYELRYGRALEEQIIEEKQKLKKLQKQKNNQKIKDNEQMLKKEAQLKKTEEQKKRDQNLYLFENMNREEQKADLFEWLEGRNWEQKMKDKEFFEKFDEKPLHYLKINDKKRYDQIMEEKEEVRRKNEEKREIRVNDVEYQNAVMRLREEMEEIKKMIGVKK